MAACRKTATWLSRFLLAVALLFGIVLMHALGHPGEHTTPGPGGTHVMAGAHEPAPDTGVESARPDHRAPAHGAGVAAVCLAVLGAGAGVILLARAARRRLPVRDVPPATALPVYALWAIPPPAPYGSLLTRLSLLRV
ncbi:DUF6153 family protein [Streptomyces sp. SR27]|uniref:DUF6153 family protein n=1 Tax=Streptomyces sp. SR27 TaxID=3076630 RepID=UPI00295B3A81|nr:DUF6153 family protein [Streptomyces sp. SR27]MDV9187435.1 DUF6153 family protein [Streptomyces sp. SR27]